VSLEPIARLIAELGRLPGIGERSAARLAYYIIRASQKQSGQHLAADLAEALQAVSEQVGLCGECQDLCATPLCTICTSPRRDRSMLCVVEGVADLRALERSGYSGLYHVLHGALAPLDGIGPQDLKIAELVARLQAGHVREIILATNANVEGDATALYVASILKDRPIKVTRLASGIPQGGELEYIDQATLGRAFSDRRDF
jgi:recombination protein RecR